jgi:hypothetical protein
MPLSPLEHLHHVLDEAEYLIENEMSGGVPDSGYTRYKKEEAQI